MRVFLAGATGAIGRQLVPLLVAVGHEVHGTTRSPDRAASLRGDGASPIVLDARDARAVRHAIGATSPDAVIHQLTDLAGGIRPEDIASTARLRQLTTRNLVEAMRAAGVSRLIAQSGAWLYGPGPLPHRESDPLLDPATNPTNVSLPGILEVERLTLGTAGVDGTILRYGFFYGPATISPERADRPSVHVAAAARATVLALGSDARGVFNVVDDDEEVSNARARRELGWDPSHDAAPRPRG